MNSFQSFFVNSYPRSGNTWIRLVLLESLNARPIDLNPVFSTRFRIFPAHTFASLSTLDAAGCIFKSHLMYEKCPQDLSPFNGVYLLRDGRDSLLSYYFYNVKHKNYTESWDVFFDRYFIRKQALNYRERILLKLMAGWGENVESYSGKKNVMIIRYEDLLSDTVNHLQEIFGFLGIDFDAYRGRIQTSLQKSNESLNQKARRDQEERKRGSVGAWQDFYSETQNNAFVSRYGQQLEKFGYLK